MDCPLCGNRGPIKIIEGPDDRIFRFCDHCYSIFIDPVFRPEYQEEKERYLTHKNGIEFPGYVRFLNRAIKPALPYLKEGAGGLDFGCGPKPTLSVILKNKGFKCDNYDPIFYQNGMNSKCYDFIFATECFEHFFNPSDELDFLCNLMKRGSLLVIMTDFYQSLKAFRTWHYVNDQTHVIFFHRQTIAFIAEKWRFTILPSKDDRVVIFRKT
ncbi:class I SAM-dependent methyltransferase [Membranihabitans maritimus]|uniref:class I SAM-dependent methyltransferase n=1 Tax=Membranihabitans maritimus TaxID=2904244 RepID=UPI001F49091A|nr:class I SAM-dependent methyltransferase [Membranihabitans maritimus]